MSEMPAGSSLTPQLRLFHRLPPSRADVDVHAISVPAREYTGDFYFAHRQGATLWLVLGDVAGKGLNAAVVMAMIQEELEHRIIACASTECDPSVTMSRLHAFLRPVLPRNKFATVVIAQLHDSGRLRVTNAGHCPPLIARRDGSIEEVGSTGPVAGLLPDARWSSTTLQLARGEALLLYSDGVTEAQKGADVFGMARLRRHFAEAAVNGSARAIASSVAAAVHEFASGPSHDDLTLFVAKR